MNPAHDFHWAIPVGWDGTVEDPNNLFARKSVTRDNMFPQERKGKQDILKLQQHGLTKDRIENGECSFSISCCFILLQFHMKFRGIELNLGHYETTHYQTL